MADKLKRCPFCGGEAEIREDYFGFYVRCEDCLSTTAPYSKEEYAISTWNNRPSPWHTGTPTEEGWYLLHLKKDSKPYCVAYMDGRHWLGINDFFILVDDVKAWQKIEPFVEATE